MERWCSLSTNRLYHLTPTSVLPAFQPLEIDRGHRQRAVVQEAADLLYRLSRFPPEISCGVTEDVNAGCWKSCLFEMPLQASVEGSAGQALSSCPWPLGQTDSLGPIESSLLPQAPRARSMAQTPALAVPCGSSCHLYLVKCRKQSSSPWLCRLPSSSRLRAPAAR